jgi:hypothetical protein
LTLFCREPLSRNFGAATDLAAPLADSVAVGRAAVPAAVVASGVTNVGSADTLAVDFVAATGAVAAWGNNKFARLSITL